MVDGGVAQNDFIVQLIAELTGLPVVRPDTVEMSVWGVASLAGEQAGLWDRQWTGQSDWRTFTRREDGQQQISQYSRWREACQRFTKWNQDKP